MHSLAKRFGLLVCFVLAIFAETAFTQALDMDKLKGMKARSIGPAGMSGRVTSIDVVNSNPDVIYIGTASGGVWKSTSGGIGWEPIFDDQPVANIGAVALDQNNPDVVWVGTGEGNPRNSMNNGNGVYKSLDGGKSWKHLGLDKSRGIHRIVLHPSNPDIVYLGVIGAAWGENPERGVYKTIDGGKNWTKVLYIDEKTGVADLVMDPNNPNKLIAAMWEYHRWPWFFKSGGPGSGIHVTFDGGESWTKRTDKDGLPKGELGRIGLAMASNRPNIVYALVEAKKNGLYGSEDGGFKWHKISERNIGNRPFYYNDIFVDPQNENRIYNIYSRVSVSEDGGKTFEEIMPASSVHPDHHAWWIHPDNPDFIIDGNDGGLAISRNRGKDWRFVENLPLAQFYHINVDMATPYNVLGGLQDNGSWRGPGSVWRRGGIRNGYWDELAFGDGFDVVPDRSDPDRHGYAMSQGGNLVRYDLMTGFSKFIKPIHSDDIPLRFNWNAGISDDPFSETTIYYGSQFVHKSTNRGDSWEIISPDLTTNDPEKQKQLDSGGLSYDVTGAENFTTIVAIEPSPLEQGVIWVGTDDGNVQLTRDGGTTWTNTVKKIKGVPEGTWVPQIRASEHNAGEAFVVFDNHRRNDWTPYVYHTSDFGNSWTRIVDDSDIFGYALALAQDPVEPRLLFLGAETGLYVSIDGSETWTKWTSGYPTVSTMDLVIHPREHDLVIGTFGRSIYVLDDIRPLRALASEGGDLLENTVHVFEIPDAVLASIKQASGTRFAGEAIFRGENRPMGALISFVANPKKRTTKAHRREAAPAVESPGRQGRPGRRGRGAPSDSAKFEILDADGLVIRTFSRAVEKGLNRTTWDLRRKVVSFPRRPGSRGRGRGREPRGASVLPGTYTVQVSIDDQQQSATVNVVSDPRLQISEADLQESERISQRLMAKVEVATEAVKRLTETQSVVEMIGKRLKGRDDDSAKAVKKKGKEVEDEIKKLIDTVFGPEIQGIRRDPRLMSSRLRTATRYLQSAPGETENIALKQAEASIEETLVTVNKFYDSTWREYKAIVTDAKVEFFDEYEVLTIKE